MAYKVPDFYQLPDGTVIPAAKTPPKNPAANDGRQGGDSKAGLEELAKSFGAKGKSNLTADDIMPWLLGGGSALIGHSIASSLLDDAGNRGRKESVWSKALKAIAKAGITGASAYGGYRLGTAMNEKSAQVTTNVLKKVQLPNGGGSVFVPKQYGELAEKIAPKAETPGDFWDKALPAHKDSVNTGASWHNFATGLEAGAVPVAGVGAWRAWQNRRNRINAETDVAWAQQAQDLADSAIDAERKSPGYRYKEGPSAKASRTASRADSGLAQAEANLERAKNPSVWKRSWPYLLSSAGLLTAGLASDYMGHKANKAYEQASDLMTARQNILDTLGKIDTKK